MFRDEEGYSWRCEGHFTYLWEARRFVKKKIKKESKEQKSYDYKEYVEYWP